VLKVPLNSNQSITVKDTWEQFVFVRFIIIVIIIFTGWKHFTVLMHVCSCSGQKLRISTSGSQPCLKLRRLKIGRHQFQDHVRHTREYSQTCCRHKFLRRPAMFCRTLQWWNVELNWFLHLFIRIIIRSQRYVFVDCWFYIVSDLCKNILTVQHTVCTCTKYGNSRKQYLHNSRLSHVLLYSPKSTFFAIICWGTMWLLCAENTI